MAWTSMHFAAGMCGGAALMAIPCLIRGRGWRYVPLAMTLGGIWANIPDMPRLWRVDFPGLPFAETLGSMDLEHWLHAIGDLFFFHRSFDAQPKEFALLGLAMVIGLYNLCLIGLLWHGRRSRHQTRDLDRDSSQEANRHPTSPPQASLNSGEALGSGSTPSTDQDNRPVIGRIGTG